MGKDLVMTKEAVAEFKKKMNNDKDLKGGVEAVRTTAINALVGIADAKGLKVDRSDAAGLLALLGEAGDGALSLDAMAGLSGGGDTGGGGGGFGGGGTGGTGGTTP